VTRESHDELKLVKAPFGSIVPVASVLPARRSRAAPAGRNPSRGSKAIERAVL
jgi:hypothetical protein